jgi:hypothetical protein
MASGDANDPPDRADQDRASRRCEKCNAWMKQLGELPALSIHAAVRVFRCYSCDHVFTERT